MERFDTWWVTETFSTSPQSNPMENTGYSRNFYDKSNSVTLLTVNYYDNYDFLNANLMTSEQIAALTFVDKGYGTPYENTKSLLTGTRVYSLDGSGYTTTVFYYDDHGDIIQKRSTNYVRGYDHYYYIRTFTGKEQKMHHEHIMPNGSIIPETYRYTYDHAERQTEIIYVILE